LKEKFLGAGSSKDSPHTVQARCSEKVISSSVPSSWTTAISAIPSVRRRAVSIDSVRRWRMSARRTRRSTTTSMVCCS
jgi:hypothetical protein